MSKIELTPYNTDRQVASYFDVSRGTIWRWVTENGFPAPVRLGPHSVRWRRRDVEAWEQGLDEAA